MSINRQQRRLLQQQGEAGERIAAAAPPPRQPQAEPEERRARAVGAPPSRRTSPRQFLHEVNVEMRKVAWPTTAETVNYSTVVFITLAILMAFLFVLDLLLTKASVFLFK
ncbi:MAG: preprotein translocase subunit SecE [Trebonia sp.]